MENAVRIYGGGSGGGLLGSSSMNGKSQELYLRNSSTTMIRSQKSVGRQVVVINATVYGGGLGGGLLERSSMDDWVLRNFLASTVGSYKSNGRRVVVGFFSRLL